MSELILPARTAELVDKVDHQTSRHPGLQLDKFSPPVPQEKQKESLEAVLTCRGDNDLLQQLRARRCAALTQESALSWSATTSAPLTLHLARASALENAGICLHPLYGFAYLPGSGLKGMARAYAETVWLLAEAGRTAGEEAIARVFGRAPKGKAEGWAGSVVFHDAWPEKWPKLIVDIVNNHHKKYYAGEDAPGDWENPEPSYFLAVPPGVAFSFALSPRRAGDDDADLALAKAWLSGALCHLGAGAKTAAGYGGFRPAEGPVPDSPKVLVGDEQQWVEWSGTLELVTPAFLAGAGQQAEDCDLRPATLRGQLRWWWRTLHAAHVDAETLRKLEATVWGSTKAGSPVRIEISPVVRLEPQLWNAGGGGISYLSYGMREKNRHYLGEGASWKVHLAARAGRYPHNSELREKHIGVPASLILEQAHAALWLLCHFGGVGSKARKGFGSLRDIDGFSIETCIAAAQRFRSECGAKQNGDPLQTPAIERMLPFSDLPIGGTPREALRHVGTALQTFAKNLPEKRDRKLLGLPRRVTTSKGKEEWLGEDHPKRGGREAKDMRDASPVHYHVAKAGDGALIFRVAVLPSPLLPDRAANRAVITALLEHLHKDITARTKQMDSLSSTGSAARPAPTAQLSAQPLQRGDKIEVLLLLEKKGKRKDKWQARHDPTGWVGYIHNSNDVPVGTESDQRVPLRVDIAKKHDFRLLWPTEEIERRFTSPTLPPSKPRPRRR